MFHHNRELEAGIFKISGLNMRIFSQLLIKCLQLSVTFKKYDLSGKFRWSIRDFRYGAFIDQGDVPCREYNERHQHNNINQPVNGHTCYWYQVKKLDDTKENNADDPVDNHCNNVTTPAY